MGKTVLVFSGALLKKMSTTLKLSGNSGILHARLFPPIILPRDSELGLLSQICWHSIPNVDETNNKLHYETGEITIPIGSDEIEDIADYLNNCMKKEHKTKPLTDEQKIKLNNNPISLVGNRQTLHSERTSWYEINFDKENSIGSLLGFQKTIVKLFIKTVSDALVNILNVQVIRVEFNLVSNSYETVFHLTVSTNCFHLFYQVIK